MQKVESEQQIIASEGIWNSTVAPVTKSSPLFFGSKTVIDVPRTGIISEPESMFTVVYSESPQKISF